jgi:hypothetical protein
MSRGNHTFRIRFWGVRGTFASPLAPQDVQQKLLDGLALLLRSPELARKLPQLASDPPAL